MLSVAYEKAVVAFACMGKGPGKDVRKNAAPRSPC